MFTVQLYHHRNRLRFENFCKRNNITFVFDGYGCGMYDPQYKVDNAELLKGCPVEVWAVDEFDKLQKI